MFSNAGNNHCVFLTIALLTKEKIKDIYTISNAHSYCSAAATLLTHPANFGSNIECHVMPFSTYAAFWQDFTLLEELNSVFFGLRKRKTSSFFQFLQNNQQQKQNTATTISKTKWVPDNGKVPIVFPLSSGYLLLPEYANRNGV